MALRQSNETAISSSDGGGGRGRTVEETYTKLTQLEHVLVRPDTYVGSVERMAQSTWVWDESLKRMDFKEVSYPPALYKIFDEILVNAADHAQRDSNMDSLKVEIDPENLTISVWNNGSGIPVEMHKKEKVYVPELIFGHLLTSSNYDDEEKKVVGGRNGFGAKLANIFSTEFIVETADTVNGKRFKQVFRNNMSSKDEPIIRANPRKEAYTKITFSPDLSRFGLTHLDDDVVSIMKKRVYDVAGVNSRLKVYLNGSKINIKTFKDYVSLYPTDPESTIQHERLNDRWEVAITASNGQLNQVSFVNSIWTIKGGTHVAHIADAIVSKFTEHIKKKNKGLTVKPFQVKSHLSLFVNCLIENPSFDSQTKETLTTKSSKFGSKWTFSDDLAKKVTAKTTVIQNILEFARFRQNKELAKSDGGKKARVTGIQKLDDANKAGSREASKCTLILTEGDSAKALAVSGLSVVGRDYFGVYPLRGKLLNVREAKHKQIMDNTEINHLKKIIGLQQNKKYDEESVKSLRYGHVLIMTDQDHDGSHIKGLVINLFDHFWPSLLRIRGFLQEFITPIVKCKKGQEYRTFFTMPQYREWVESPEANQRGWVPKYYKGLGTSTAAEAKGYFSNLPIHLLQFNHKGEEDTNNIDLAFSKQRVNDRKDWLSAYQPGTYFDHVEDELNYSNFVNKELILFSVADNSRSIPNIIDGFKPSQRKVLFACFKRRLTKNEIKVAQLGGYVSEHAAYHHGEMSLQSTIVGLAQNFVGSNNINLLVPAGQFGTRLQGGKDAASSRYIFTKLSEITRALIPEVDDPLLEYLEEDGKSIEPKWYCPAIPLVLVNGSDGIGTGWSSSVPCYNPRDLIKNITRLLNGEEMEPMIPWYRGFTGHVVPVENAKSFDVYGTLRPGREENSFKIDELPIRSWTSPYKEFLESSMIGTPDAKNPFIKDFQDNGTENKVKFTFTTTAELSGQMNSPAAYKRLKLSTSLSTNNMVLFDSEGRIRKYDTPEEIVLEFYHVRLNLYNQRRVHLLHELEQELLCLDNKQRFILMVIDGKLKVAKRKKIELVKDLKRLEFAQIHKKKKSITTPDQPEEDSDDEENNDGISERESGYDYLLSMPLWSLTIERVRQLGIHRDKKAAEKEAMNNTTGKELWEKDLQALEEALAKDEVNARKQAEDLERVAREARRKQRRGGGAKRKNQKAVVYEESDDDDDEMNIVELPSVRTVTAKVPRVRKAPAAPKIKATDKKKPVTAKRKAAGNGRKTASAEFLSSSEEEQSEMADLDEISDEDDFVADLTDHNDGGISDALAEINLEVGPRAASRRTQRNAAKKTTKYVISDDELDDDAEMDLKDDDNNDDDAFEEDDLLDLTEEAPKKKKPVASKAKSKKSAEKPKADVFELDNDSDLDEIQPMAKKTTAAAKPKGRKKVSILESSKPKASSSSNYSTAVASTASILNIDEDEEEEDDSDIDNLPLSSRIARRLKGGLGSKTSSKASSSSVAPPPSRKVTKNNNVKRKSVPKAKASQETVDLLLSPGKSPMPKKSRVKSPAVAKRGGRKKKVVEEDDDDDDDDDTVNNQATAQVENLVEDDNDEVKAVEPTRTTTTSRTTRPKRSTARKVTVELDYDDEDEVDADDDDSDAEFDEDDDEDFEV